MKIQTAIFKWKYNTKIQPATHPLEKREEEEKRRKKREREETVQSFTIEQIAYTLTNQTKIQIIFDFAPHSCWNSDHNH